MERREFLKIAVGAAAGIAAFAATAQAAPLMPQPLNEDARRPIACSPRKSAGATEAVVAIGAGAVVAIAAGAAVAIAAGVAAGADGELRL
jgi:hypothetical protein